MENDLLPITPGVYRMRDGGIRRVIMVGVDSHMPIVVLSNIGTVSQRYPDGKVEPKYEHGLDLIVRIGDLP